MTKTITATRIPPSANLQLAWQGVESSFERFCLTAGIGAIEQMLRDDAQMISSQPLTFEILRSVDSGVAPHHRSPASATEPAGQDLWASSLPERATVPLQSQANASPFLIMFLLSSGTFEREIIEVAADPTPALWSLRESNDAD